MQQLQLDWLQQADVTQHTALASLAEGSVTEALIPVFESAGAAQQQLSLQQAAWQQFAWQQSPHASQQAAREVLSPAPLSTEPINSKDAANNLNMSFFLEA